MKILPVATLAAFVLTLCLAAAPSAAPFSAPARVAALPKPPCIRGLLGCPPKLKQPPCVAGMVGCEVRNSARG